MSEIAAYIRVSTEDQRDNYSHVRQRDTIAEWADRNDYQAGEWDAYHSTDADGEIAGWDSIDGETTGDVTWHEDIAVSGQADEREGYSRLMDRYQNFEAVVFRELSRFGRDPSTVIGDATEIMENDVGFVSVTESEWDSTSASGKFMMRQFANMNAFYADLRREQAIKGVERRKEQGLNVGRPKKLDGAQMSEAFDLRRKGVSYQDIARIIETRPDGPDEISRETIRRYCKNEGVEPEYAD